MEKKELACGALFGAGFMALIAASAAAWPELFAAFLNNAHRLGGERGEIDQSSWALMNDVARWFHAKIGWDVPAWVPPGIYAMLLVVVLGVSAGWFRRLNFIEEAAGDLWRICLVCLLFAVLVPRMKNYSYILLIGPAFLVLKSSRWLNPALPLCGLLVIYNFRNFQILGTALEPFYQVQGEYYCLILAWLLWALCGGCVWRLTKAENNENGISRPA